MLLLPLAQASDSKACGDYSSCSRCLAAPQSFGSGCGWCGDSETGSCAEGDDFGPSGTCADSCWNFGFSGTCARPCQGTTCSDCINSGDGCGWCALTKTCDKSDVFGNMCSDSKGVICNDWQSCLVQAPDSSSACPRIDCSRMTTCGACASNDGCGWCASSQACIEGDSFVNLCQDCPGDFSCFKADASSSENKCPVSVCSQHSKCSECAVVAGCGWDAKLLSCVELQTGATGSCQSSTDSACIYQQSDMGQSTAATTCPSTPNELCSDYSDCRSCTQDAMCGWSTNGECVEASIRLGAACRGSSSDFSYWDCEPHCQSIRDCTACLSDDSGCTMCSAELLDEYNPRVSRCVLAKGAQYGIGDKSTPVYNHSCAAVHDQPSACTKCSQHDLPTPIAAAAASDGTQRTLESAHIPFFLAHLPRFSRFLAHLPRFLAQSHWGADGELEGADGELGLDAGSGSLPPPPPPPGDVELACTSCVADPECGACIAPPPPGMPYKHRDLKCVYGDRDGPYAGSCSMPARSDVPYWIQSSQSTSDVCSDTDLCSTFTSCDMCQSAHTLGCTWCNETLPLQSSPLSPCRKLASCPAEYRQEPFSCPTHACEDLNVSCTDCVARHSCGWASYGCVTSTDSFSFSHLPFIWAEPQKCPEVCGAHTSCGECAAAEGCGWCGDQCVAANGTTPDYRATGETCSPFYTAANQGQCGAGGGTGGGTSPAVIALASVGGIVAAGVAASVAANVFFGTSLTAIVMGRSGNSKLWLGPGAEGLLGSVQQPGEVEEGAPRASDAVAASEQSAAPIEADSAAPAGGAA